LLQSATAGGVRRQMLINSKLIVRLQIDLAIDGGRYLPRPHLTLP